MMMNKFTTTLFIKLRINVSVSYLKTYRNLSDLAGIRSWTYQDAISPVGASYNRYSEVPATLLDIVLVSMQPLTGEVHVLDRFDSVKHTKTVTNNYMNLS